MFRLLLWFLCTSLNVFKHNLESVDLTTFLKFDFFNFSAILFIVCILFQPLVMRSLVVWRLSNSFIDLTLSSFVSIMQTIKSFQYMNEFSTFKSFAIFENKFTCIFFVCTRRQYSTRCRSTSRGSISLGPMIFSSCHTAHSELTCFTRQSSSQSPPTRTRR